MNNCKNCGKELTGRKLSFCCYSCKEEYYNGENFKRVCITCGKEFTGTRFSKYCSDSCKKIKNKCITCGKEFIGSKTKKYCSRSCQNNNASKNKCIMCGKEFIGVYGKKYCSDSCRNKGVLNKLDNRRYEKELNAFAFISSKYQDFNIINSYYIKSELFIELECKHDGYKISEKYDNIINSNLKCPTCEINDYYLSPNRCEFCNSILEFNKKERRFCSNECNKKSKLQNTNLKIQENKDLLTRLFQSGYTELKIKDITTIPLHIIKKFLYNENNIKKDLIYLDETILKIIKNNTFIDFKSEGLTRDASIIFKNKYETMYNFLETNNIDSSNKYFKCSKCNTFHNIDDFNLKNTGIKKSFFGVGTCKKCIKLQKNKRKRKSKHIDSFLNTNYLLNIENKFNNRCAICGSTENIHLDHFIPLAWNLNTPLKGNYILLCENCNVCHKRDKNLKDWMSSYDIDYSDKINSIMEWLASENDMDLNSYKKLYWDTYKKHIATNK